MEQVFSHMGKLKIDPYIWELPVAFGYGGYISEREYADYYYRDFFYYTRTKNKESLIMCRYLYVLCIESNVKGQ